MTDNLPKPPLLIITDTPIQSKTVEEVVEAALGAGGRWFMYRDKKVSSKIFRKTANYLFKLCREFNAELCLNERVDIAKSFVGAGVHIQSGSEVSSARYRLGTKALIGVSCHSIDEAEEAEKAGADYITYSPVFETSSKPGYGPPAGLAGIKEASAKVSIPVVALAGIKPSNVKSCIVSGARGVAVMGGVMQSLNPGREVEELIAAIK